MMLLIAVILPLSFMPSAQSATGDGELAGPSGHGGVGPTLLDTRGAGDRQAVLIGVPGLTWADLSPAKSPNLWRLAAGGAIASLSVRTVGTWTCPMDGWLTVSAGPRAASPRRRCGELPADPERRDGGWYAATVPAARQVNMASNFRAAVGSLGDAVHQAGGTVLAVGPGAAVAAADSKGRLDEYAP